MKYILDGKKMTSRKEAHAYLKEVLGFPDYYGNNLDALQDCLTECADLEITFLNCAEMLEHLGNYGEKLLAVFREIETIQVEVK